MNSSVLKLRGLCGLHNSLLPTRSVYHNLNREFVQISGGRISGTNPNVLTSSQCNRVPCRSFYKQKVEVEKRIQWKRPVEPQSVLPVKSGDLSGSAQLDLNEPPPLFKECAEFHTANDYVKRIFSLKFQPTAVVKELKCAAMTEKVKRHTYDTRSVEVKIAKLTAVIRNMQIHYQNEPLDHWRKADLKEIIDLRKKKLKRLRTFDYKRFEWLLEKLDLLYKPPPTFYQRVERKKSIRWLAAQYIERVKEKKLEEYKQVLESQKRGFLEGKLAAMKTIVEEEKSVGTEPSFTAEDIEKVKQALDLIVKEEEEALKQSGTEVKEIY